MLGEAPGSFARRMALALRPLALKAKHCMTLEARKDLAVFPLFETLAICRLKDCESLPLTWCWFANSTLFLCAATVLKLWVTKASDQGP